MEKVIKYLNKRFENIGNFKDFYIDFQKSISIKEMMNYKDIVPFVRFGSSCGLDTSSTIVLVKGSLLN